MRAAIIIPVHNRREVTLRCLRSLHAPQLPADFAVIVVDDGSTDGTAAAIAAEFPGVMIEAGDGQLYWTGGIVRGMKRALIEGAQFLFWLNDDCLPEAGALQRMLRHLEENPRTICGASCFVKGESEPVQTGFVQRRRLNTNCGVTEVHGLSGYCVGMPATVAADIGLPDAVHLPHYAADGIYTLQAHRSGYRIVLLGDARVTILDGRAMPSLQDRVRASRLTFPAFIRQTFLARKSPFFLSGQYWYHRYKYGFLPGGLLFLVKMFRWAWTITFSWHRRSCPSLPNHISST